MVGRTTMQLISVLSAVAALLAVSDAVRAATVSIPAGANVQTYIAANPSGTTFLLASGTYTNQTISPAANDIFIGAGDIHSSTPTVFDGGGSVADFVNCYGATTGCQLENMVVQNYTPVGSNPGDPNNAYEIWTGPSWVLSDVDVENSGVDGVNLYTGSHMIGGEVKSCGHRGLGVESDTVINNVEIAYNNTDETSQTGGTADAAGLKGGGASGVTVVYCSVHNNHAIGIWADVGSTGWYIQNNFVQNNDYTGIQYEISTYGTIYENLVNNNGGSHSSYSGNGQIGIIDSNYTNVYRNTVVAAAYQNAIWLQSDSITARSDALVTEDDGLNNNFVTFTGTGGYYGLSSYEGGDIGSNNYSQYNTFILNMGTSAAVFLWNGYQPDNLLSFSTLTSTKGEDTASTVSQW